MLQKVLSLFSLEDPSGCTLSFPPVQKACLLRMLSPAEFRPSPHCPHFDAALPGDLWWKMQQTIHALPLL